MRIAAAIALMAVAAALVATTPQVAHAASFTRCGNAGTMYSGQLKLANVGALHITCRKARRFARRFERKAGEETGYRCAEDFYCTWRGWQCRNDGRSRTVINHRCETINTHTHKVMVVKWVDRPS